MYDNLIETFKDFKFYADDHHYEVNKKRIGISVTTLIHEYSNPFNKESVSKKVSLKTNRPQADILEDWRLENLYSTVKGTLIHEYAQGLWNGEKVLPNYEEISDEINLNRLKKTLSRSFKLADKYYEEHKNQLTVFKDEFIVGSIKYDIAGSIDNLLLTNNNELVMIDYKTNKKINFNSFNSQKMLEPLNNLEDCNYIHYSLQLCIYKLLIEEFTDIKVKNVYIVYFDEFKDDYEKIKVKNVLKEAQILLNTRL